MHETLFDQQFQVIEQEMLFRISIKNCCDIGRKEKTQIMLHYANDNLETCNQFNILLNI